MPAERTTHRRPARASGGNVDREASTPTAGATAAAAGGGGQADLDPQLLAYLRDVGERPFVPARERDERLGVSRYQGVQARRRLSDLGLVHPHRISTGRRAGQLLLLELTQAGEEHLRAAGMDVHRDPDMPFRRSYYLHELTAYVARMWPAARIDRPAASSRRFPDLVALFEQHPDGQARELALIVLMEGEVEDLTLRLGDPVRFDHIYVCTETSAAADAVLDTLRKTLPAEHVDAFTVGPVTAFLGQAPPASTRRRGYTGRAPGRSRRRRRPSPLMRDVLEAYQHLHDLDWLQDSPLVELDAVRERANPLNPMPEAQVLRGLLIDAATRAAQHARDVPSLAALPLFLERYTEGRRVSEIAEELGVSREWCSKSYRKRALELAGGQFIRLTALE